MGAVTRRKDSVVDELAQACGSRRRRGVQLWPLCAASVAVMASAILAPTAVSAENADLRRRPPAVTALEVQLASEGHGPSPRECRAWPSCERRVDNARLFIRFDAADLGSRELAARLALDLAGAHPVEIERGEDGVYSGSFCLDTRALCEIERARVHSSGGADAQVAIFRGREVVRRQPAVPVDMDALWQGRRVSLMSSVPACNATDPAKTLFITDTAVTTNEQRTYTPCGPQDSTGMSQPAGTPLGKWTLGRLAQGMAGSVDAKAFLQSWLLQLDPRTPATINGFPVPARPGLRRAFLVPWCRASAPGAACDADDDTTLELDPAKAPFRLLAIVNRIDLADVFGFASAQPGSAGELRFVFAAEKWGDCKADMRFFVILEYEVTKSSCSALTQWANDWLALDGLTGAAYLDKLDSLVESVVARPPGRVRVRTSEVAFVDPAKSDSEAWAMRQFELENGALVAKPLSRTPDRSFQTQPALALLGGWIVAQGNEADIGLDRHEIPDELPGHVPLAAAVGPMRPSSPSSDGTFWELPGVGTLPDTPHHFSLNTCTACHAGETATAATHTTPYGGFGSAILLSTFLKGGTVDDPRAASGQVVKHEYHDLCRRAEVLACIAQGFGTPCLCDVTLQKLSTPH